jgi:predicted nucleic acid-binding protein
VTLVVDASVAAKWVLDEEGTERALALRSEDGLIAPSLLVIEVGSAIWKAARRELIAPANAIAAIRDVLLPFEALVPDEELRVPALALALNLRHPIYDCFYLALAERERCTLITADARLIGAAKTLKRVEVRPLD